MIMLGVLNKKKCLPLKSFARHRWWKKRYGDCGPIRGQKKGGKPIYCTTSCKAEPLCFLSTTLGSRLHLLMAESKENTLSSEISNTSEAEHSSHLSDLQASGLAPISKDRTVPSRFSCISTQRLLSPSASAELKQT